VKLEQPSVDVRERRTAGDLDALVAEHLDEEPGQAVIWLAQQYARPIPRHPEGHTHEVPAGARRVHAILHISAPCTGEKM